MMTISHRLGKLFCDLLEKEGYTIVALAELEQLHTEAAPEITEAMVERAADQLEKYIPIGKRSFALDCARAVLTAALEARKEGE